MPIFYSELVRIYEVRNAIHLQAELKKEIAYQLQLSKIAYKRMVPFLAQIKAKLAKDKLIDIWAKKLPGQAREFSQSRNRD